MSYDLEYDGDLYDRLVEQASRSASRFEILSRSGGKPENDFWDEELRSAIRNVDEMIVICGECTDGSARMGTELRIAQEEERPYLLLWGRREFMCTRPATAKPADSMYSWTWEILQRQILDHQRAAEASRRAAERSLRKAAAAPGREKAPSS